jgi:hypothetical protein
MTTKGGQKQGSDNPEARRGTGKRKKRKASIGRRSNKEAERKANLMIVRQIYAKLRGSHLIAMRCENEDEQNRSQHQQRTPEHTADYDDHNCIGVVNY